jgi:uncharacterized membrane protein YcaP (DUF421 family)
MHLPNALDRAARPRGADPDGSTLKATYSIQVWPSIPAWELVLRGVTIYVALLVALRLFGKREVGQFTLYDLVFILLVANALQPAITGPDTSIVGGLVLIVALVLTNYVVGRLDRLPRFHHIFTPVPAVVVKDGKCLAEVMRREGVDQAEIEMAVREHGIEDLKEVKLGVLEPDGTISIVPSEGIVHRSKHRVRYHHRAG